MRRGFTLIELLAVIVILAVIALIAYPVITGIVEKSKKSSALRGVEGYVEAANNASVLYDLDNNKGINVTESKHTFTSDEDALDFSKIKAKGTIPTYSYIDYNIKTKTVREGHFCINGYSVIYKNNQAKISNTNYCEYTNQPDKAKVIFELNGGLLDIDYLYYNQGETYDSLPIPTKDGFRFDGWYTEDTFEHLVNSSDIVASIDEYSLYAKYSVDRISLFDNGTVNSNLIDNFNPVEITSMTLSKNSTLNYVANLNAYGLVNGGYQTIKKIPKELLSGNKLEFFFPSISIKSLNSESYTSFRLSYSYDGNTWTMVDYIFDTYLVTSGGKRGTDNINRSNVTEVVELPNIENDAYIRIWFNGWHYQTVNISLKSISIIS